MPKSVFLKTDTQGNDLEVILSGGEWTNRIKTLLVEVSSIPIYEGVETLPEMHDRLDSLGYRIMGMYPVSWDSSGAVVEFDALYGANT